MNPQVVFTIYVASLLFQNPSKFIRSFAIDPVHAAWVVVACADMSLYLLPALAHLKVLYSLL